MRSRFISQPFEDGFDLRDFLRRVLTDSRIKRLDIAVAWARRSGLRQVENELRDFRSRGGFVRLIVGISQGGATKQGLELAMELADEVSVFHDPSGRTFHVKVYAAYDSDTAEVLVGSHNLTGGGTVRNYEAGNHCELNLANLEDQEYLQSISGFFERLLDDQDICIRLDAEVLAQLVTETQYRIADEDSSAFAVRTGYEARIEAEDQVEGVQNEAAHGESLFGRSKHALRNVPPVGGASVLKDGVSGGIPAAGPVSTKVVPAAGPSSAVSAKPAVVVKRWFKRLDPANAQRPVKSTTKRTGHLTLTKNRFPIDTATYFRNDFFRTVGWASVKATRERAVVPFDVEIHGVSHGVIHLEVDHNPAFVAGQDNRATTVRWGTQLNSHLRAHNYVGDTVSIELLPDGSFRLIVSPDPIGPFIK